MIEKTLCPDCNVPLRIESDIVVCKCGTTWHVQMDTEYNDERDEVIQYPILYRQEELSL